MKGKEKPEETFKKENQRLTNILESIPDAFISLDRNWRYSYLNKAAENILHRKKEDLLGKDVREEYKDSHAFNFYSRYEIAMTEGVGLSFEEFYEPFGKWFEIRVFPSDGGISVLFRDITDKKLVEKELEDSRRDLKHAQEVSKTGSWRLLVKQNKLIWSDETYNIFGIPTGTVMNYDLFISSVHPEDREYVSEKWNEALKTGFYDIEHRIVVNGAVKWVNEKAELEFDNEGSLVSGFGTVQDISERKRQEENLKEQKYFLEQVLESVPFAYWIIDKNGKVIKANKKAEELWIGDIRYVDKDHYNEYKTWYHDTHKLLSVEQHAVSRAIARGETTYQEVLDIQCFDGTIKTIFNYCTPFYDNCGNIIGALDINQDVTGLIKLQEDLKLSEERFRTLASAAFEGIAISEEGIIKEANEQFAKMHGYTLPEVIGAQVGKFQHPDERTGVGKIISEGVEKSGEFRNIRKDGTEIIVESHGRTIQQSGRLLRIVTMRDITERKKVDQVLQTTLSRFYHVLSSMYTAVLLVSEEGIVEFANQAFCDIYDFKEPPLTFRGITSDCIIEKIKNAYPDSDEAVKRIREIVKLGKPVKGEEVIINGAKACIRDFIPLFINGKSYGRLWHHVDISERKMFEETLKQAIEALKISNHELEQFAYVASHDLQEPLRMLSYFSKLLGNKYKGVLDSRADEYIGYIEESAKRMQALISDLLTYARVSSRQRPFARVDLNEIICDILKDLNLVIVESGVEIKCESLPAVKADPMQLKQLFQNLIQNAIKFRNREKPEIHISSELLDGSFQFCVRDNGIGVKAEFFERIFVIFQRLHEREKYPGTGIGLAICKKIVEGHGGKIWVESGEGKGSAFYFSLPC